jgi:hypothetical protein
MDIASTLYDIKRCLVHIVNLINSVKKANFSISEKEVNIVYNVTHKCYDYNLKVTS